MEHQTSHRVPTPIAPVPAPAAQTQTKTKTDLEMESRMHAVAGDPLRVNALAKARIFKRSWIELAEVLSEVLDAETWQGWGYAGFEEYCKAELHLTPATVHKLLGSFRFLKTSAPRVIERARAAEHAAPLPSFKAVDFVARAAERGAAGEEAMREIEHAAFEEGAEAPALSRRFKTVAFPVSSGEALERLRSQLGSAARRLANLIAEPDAPVPRELAITVEETLGDLMAALSDSPKKAEGGTIKPANEQS